MKGVKENETTGKYWTCPNCGWEGPNAPIDAETYKIMCPKCDSVIDDRLHEQVAEDTDNFA